MKLLAITYAFVPLHCPATYRLLKWFTYLSEQGHDITAVVVDPDSIKGLKDAGLERFVPRGVHRVMTRSPVRDLSYRILNRFSSQFYRMFEPDARPWYRPALKTIRSLPLRDFDVIFSCSHPPICHVLGLEVKQETGLPWVAYFSDPWVNNPYRVNGADRIQAYNKSLERQVVESVDQLIFSSPETTRLVVQPYPREVADKSAALDHCYVPEWFDAVHVDNEKSDGAVRVVLTGNFYGPRTPLPFLRLLQDLDSEVPLGGKVVFHFYGKMDPAIASDALWSDLGHIVKCGGEVDYLTSLALMRSADLLLLIDAPVAPGKESVFFPSKLAEYLGSGTPIVGITPAKGTSARVLEESGYPVVDPSNTSEIRAVIRRVVAREMTVLPRHTSIAKYDYRGVGQQLADIMQAAIRRASSRSSTTQD